MNRRHFLLLGLFILRLCWSNSLTTFAGESLPALVKRIQPAVVTISTYTESGAPSRTGTGFFIERGGLLATNAHVISGAFSAKIKTKDGDVLAVAGVAALDHETDIALLSINRAEGSNSSLHLAAPLPEVGERVFAIGSPFGLEQTLTDGLVSSIRTGEAGTTVIQISVPISPGSSGSPVVNSNGDVVGMIVSQLLKGQNINFAIPSYQLSSLPVASITTLPQLFIADTRHAIREIRADTYPAWLNRIYSTEDIDAIIYRGMELLNTDKAKDALPYLALAAIKSSDREQAWCYLAGVYATLGENEKTQLAVREASKRKPEYLTPAGLDEEKRLAENEMRAMASMRTLVTGPLVFRSTHGQFPRSLAEMGEEPFNDEYNLIPAKLASGMKDGYKFTYIRTRVDVFDDLRAEDGVPTQQGFIVMGHPIVLGKTGRVCFYADEHENIRFSTKGVAGPSSPLLEIELVTRDFTNPLLRVGGR